jgi:hypothetical protein
MPHVLQVRITPHNPRSPTLHYPRSVALRDRVPCILPALADYVHHNLLGLDFVILDHYNDLRRPQRRHHHRGDEQQRSVRFRGRRRASGTSLGRVTVRGDRHGNNAYRRTCLSSRFPVQYASIPAGTGNTMGIISTVRRRISITVLVLTVFPQPARRWSMSRSLSASGRL